MDERVIEGTKKIAQDGFKNWFDGLGLRVRTVMKKKKQ